MKTEIIRVAMMKREVLVVAIFISLLLVTACRHQVYKLQNEKIIIADTEDEKATSLDSRLIESKENPILKKEINTYNWLNHPDIVVIRDIYNEIEELIALKKGSEDTKSKEYCEPYRPTHKAIFIDDNEKVRKYIEEAGSDDSALTKNYYYDLKGILRFMFITGGAVNGTIIEHRIYFDSQGEKIWEIHELKDGPGYTFPQVWPVEDYVKDPIKKYEIEES